MVLEFLCTVCSCRRRSLARANVAVQVVQLKPLIFSCTACSCHHDPCLCFVAGAYRTQLALCISCHLSNLRQDASYDTECMVCKHSTSPSCLQYSSWPKQVKFVPLGPEGERWDAPVYFKIGRSLVMASLDTTSKIMNLARDVQAHLN